MSITPLAAALAARPVPPRTPTKDYADLWLPVTLGTLAVVLVLLGVLSPVALLLILVGLLVAAIVKAARTTG